MGSSWSFWKKSNDTIGSFYRNKKERGIFIVIESISIVIVANKKNRSKNSSSSHKIV